MGTSRIIETPFELDPALLKSGLESDIHLLEPRSPGVHHSDIIRDLENAVIKPGLRRPDVDVSDEEMATLNRYRELGYLWEICIEAAFKQRQILGLDPKKYLRQVEIEHDHVFKTIDAIYIPDWRVIEYKLTFRSSRRTGFPSSPCVDGKPYTYTDGDAAQFNTDFWNWVTQLKSNCLGHGTRLATLFAFFVCGSYQPPVPQTRRFDFVFDDQDLIDTWRMLKNHEAVMRREGRIK
jgi:hypothetical protein